LIPAIDPFLNLFIKSILAAQPLQTPRIWQSCSGADASPGGKHRRNPNRPEVCGLSNYAWQACETLRRVPSGSAWTRTPARRAQKALLDKLGLDSKKLDVFDELSRVEGEKIEEVRKKLVYGIEGKCSRTYNNQIMKKFPDFSKWIREK